ncbi:MAG: Holliday junction resolvase RuvX [Clostridia bacterium]|nr:Holliday junction resolvase RuvX [Clostridia bacterium]
MVIMSVDYGDARTGIAMCDRLETLAYPVEVIKGGYAPKVADRIGELAIQHKPELIVVGYPKNMDSSEGFRAEKCAKFADLIAEITQIPVKLWDERLTTVSAYHLLNEADTHGKKRKKVIDAVAATVILQDFLNYRRNSDA